LLLKDCLDIISFFNIDEISLLEGIQFFRFMKVEQNHYIFKDGDHSKNFYGILQGRVSIRHRKKEPEVKKWEEMETVSNNIREKISLMSQMTVLSDNIEDTSNQPNRKDSRESLKSNPGLLSFRRQVNSNLAKSTLQASFLRRMSEKMRVKISKIEEVEVEILNKGSSFGEINSLKNVPKRGSALALETCHLVVVDRANYERTALSKVLNKIDIEKKYIINATFPQLEKLAQHKLEEFYKCFDTIFLRRNQVVFYEQEQIDNVYIVFKGECSIKKDITKPYQPNKHLQQANYEFYEFNKTNSSEVKELVYRYANDELIKNKNVKSVLTLVKGNLAGVELSAGLKFYNHSLIVSSDQAVLLSVNKNKLIELRIGLLESFFNLFLENESLIEKNVSTFTHITEKMKINYRTGSYSILEYKDKKLKSEEENKVILYIDKLRNNKTKQINNRLDLRNSFLSQSFKPKPIHKKILSHDVLFVKNFPNVNLNLNLNVNVYKESDENIVQGSSLISKDSFIKSKLKTKLLIKEKNTSQQNTARTSVKTGARSSSNGRNYSESKNEKNYNHLTRNLGSSLFSKDFSVYAHKVKNFTKFTDEENKTILKYDSGNYNLPLLALDKTVKSKKMKSLF
jgi:CRP-like cAMP-binding protein